MPDTVTLTPISEVSRLSENVASVTNHRMKIRIIEGDRWGSSGYYSRTVLERDGAEVFPSGTHMYLDHPSAHEEHDRPERTLRDLVGVLVTDPVYEKDGLYAEVGIYNHWADVIAEMAADIGISIRAVAEMEPGTVGDRSGPIITRLVEGISVDFVTRAGAGGEIVQILESARQQVEEQEVSNKPWSQFKSSDYTLAQWKRACLVKPDTPSDRKGDYKIPVREPNGTLNRNAVHAAAGGRGISAVKGISDEKRRAVARKLVSLYRNALKEDPPDSLLKLAGMSEKESREATANNRRDQLNLLLSRTYGGEEVHVWVRDLDEENRTVYYSVYTYDSHRMFGHEFEPSSDDLAVSLVGSPYEVMTQTQYVPVPAELSPAPAPVTGTTDENKKSTSNVNEKDNNKKSDTTDGSPNPVKEDKMGEVTIEERELTALRASAERAEGLSGELEEARKGEKEARIGEARATRRANYEHARRVVADEMHEAGIKGKKLSEALAQDPPLHPEGHERAGQVDEDKLREAVKESLGEVQSEMAEGGVRGFGTASESAEVTDEELDKLSARAFSRETKKVGA